jgi:hypothetical protein
MIKEIIEKHGPAKIAIEMGESTQTVSNWRYRGVPLEQAVDFCRAVSYEVTPHVLYPKNYPNPNDGLPHEFIGIIPPDVGRRCNDRRHR